MPFFAERLARHGVVRPNGMVLVSGTAREASRRLAPRPGQATAVLMFEGTADRLVPFRGGRGTGPLAWMARRRARRLLVDLGGGEVVSAQTTAADWAGANGCSPVPTVETLAAHHADLSTDRLSWTGQGCRPVILYKIAGGGHGWPGGPQYMPAVLVGPIARSLDASGILLEFARAETGSPN